MLLILPLTGGFYNALTDSNPSDTGFRCPLPFDATITRAFAELSAAPGSGKSWTISMAKNGVADGDAVVLSDAETSEIWTPDLAFTAGDRFNTSVVSSGSPAATGLRGWVEWDTGSEPAFHFGTTGTVDPDGIYAYYVIPAACTIDRLYARLSDNSGGSGYVFTIYKNGSATGITCTSSGGMASDLTHSATFAAGDVLGIHIHYDGGANRQTTHAFRITPDTPNRFYWLHGQARDWPGSGGYDGILGTNTSVPFNTFAETDTQSPVPDGYKLKSAAIYSVGTVPSGSQKALALVRRNRQKELVDDFEGGSNGSVVSGDWEYVQQGAHGQIKYSNVQARGALSAAFIFDGSPTEAFLERNGVGLAGIGKDFFLGFDLWLPVGWDADTPTLAKTFGSALQFQILTSGGSLIFRDQSGNTMVTIASVAAGQWIGFDIHLVGHASTGSIEVKYFDDPDDPTPTETQTSGSTYNTDGGDVSTIRVGPHVLTSRTAYVENFYVNNMGYRTRGSFPPARTLTAISTGGVAAGLVSGDIALDDGDLLNWRFDNPAGLGSYYAATTMELEQVVEPGIRPFVLVGG